MTRINKKRLNSNITNLRKLENVRNEISHIRLTISEFINDSKKALTGEGYNAVRERLSYFTTILEKEELLCQIVENNFIAGNQTMIDYMEEFDVLDTADLEKVEKSLNWSRTQINELSKKITSLIKEDDSSELLQGIRKSLAGFTSSYEFSLRLKNKLEGLEEIDTMIDSSISSTYSDCSRINRAINKI